MSETGHSRATKAIVSPAVGLGFSMEMTSIGVKKKRQLYACIKESTVVVRQLIYLQLTADSWERSWDQRTDA